MWIVAAAVCGVLLDLILGDPAWLVHPVVVIGRCISALETILRDMFPDNEKGAFRAGVLMAVLIPAGTFLVTGFFCWLLRWMHPLAGFALQTFWCWQALAMRGLRVESRHVYAHLKYGDLKGARKAVSRIVGRDTDRLTEQGVTRATVETIAENSSDGVIAPLFYMAIGGAPLALTYKAINTMDSMLGYKNEKYLYFGRAAARLDDAANYIPARIAAVFWILAALFTGNHAGQAAKIWVRDRRKHASPNSAQTESACAGALGVQLAGPAWYFGTYYDKPAIGDPDREIRPEDILKTNRMMYCAGLLAAAAFLAARYGILALAAQVLH